MKKVYVSSMNNFWSKVDKTPGHGPWGNCWLWVKVSRKDGYAKFQVNGIRYFAHRLSWILTYGPIPDGLKILHACDVRNCVNPGHLFDGTQRDNIVDMDSKGRRKNVSGENQGSSKVTQLQVDLIRTLRAEGRTFNELSKEFHISIAQISNITHNRQWKGAHL